MRHVIKFDSSSWKFDKKDMMANYFRLIDARRRLMDLLKYRGYVYLNQVYETLGVRWYPSEHNVLFTRENENEESPMEFGIEMHNDERYIEVVLYY